LTTVRTWLLAAAALAAAAPQAAAQPPASPVHLLDVPYLPQDEALCGGAAAAMVMRFWGARGVYADTFGGLVDPKAQGIHTADLVRSMQSRGWQALAFKGDLPLLRSHVDRGRPVIVLIEDRPDRFHYVVVVALAEGNVIVHDPARAPFRVLDTASFTRAWERADFWSLLALPPPDLEKEHAAKPEAPASAGGPCDGMVEEGVRLAQVGQNDDARRVLEMAAAACPTEPGPWRERAGLHAVHDEWREAAADARQALYRDPRDQHAARILATSLFVQGDAAGALDAWNVAGEPTIDLVNVSGLDRTRYAVVARALRLERQALLTSSGFRRAQRRAAAIPSALVTRVSYRPDENGRAQIDAAIVERPLAPSGIAGFGAIGLRAVTDRELSGALASPSGGGELWTASWRWWENRPREALSFSAPAAAPLPGIWRIEAFGEKQTYAAGTATAIERRRGMAVQLSDWASGEWKWVASVGIDRWTDGGMSVAIGAGSEYRAFADRLSAGGRVSVFQGNVDTWTAQLGSEWRSRARNEGRVWLLRVGFDAAGADAPLALWPGAGSGQGRDVLLRAHPLLRDGIIGGGVFGRRLAHGGAEWRRWLRPVRGTLRVAPALFADAASASESSKGFESRAQMDAGVGLRIAVPGAGSLRLDLARGLRGGGTVFSAGWTR
jgi:hypothetical protein